MKILITGTFSSGKTTFCQKLYQTMIGNGFDVGLLSDTARLFSLPLNLEQDAEISATLIGVQIGREMCAAKENKYMICDRGVPDIWSHNLDCAADGRGISNSALNVLAQDCASTYDVIVQSKLSRSIKVERDNLRVIDAKYRDKMELLHRQAMTEMGLVAHFEFNSDPKENDELISRLVNGLAVKY